MTHYKRHTAHYSAIVAMTHSRVIGRKGSLPWHIPDETAFFKRLTTGHTVIMGRETYESIGKPLPDRRNIVLSTSLEPAPGIEVAGSIVHLTQLKLEGEVFIIGGQRTYQEMLPYCDDVIVSLIKKEYSGDRYMPRFEDSFPKVEHQIIHPEFDIYEYHR